jgi:Zn-dependent protease with chaperone function
LKIVSLAALCLLSSVLTIAQEWSPSFVASRCGGAVIADGAAAEKVKQVALLLDGGELAAQTYLINSNVINAWTVPADGSHSLVCVPLGLVLWFRGADGELAYVMAHEFGHAIDEACASSEGRAKLAQKSKSPYSLLFGTSNGNESGDSRKCEMRADLRAFMFMAQAGIDTDYAISAMKRFQAARHDHRKGAIGKLFAINDSHPLWSDRIKQMERLQESFRKGMEPPQ